MLYVTAFRKIRYEEIWLQCSPVKTNPNDIGRQQFWDFDSRGTVPSEPNPYFICLYEGRKWFHWTQTQYRESLIKGEWPGWYQISKDFEHENKEFFDLMFKWYKNIPEWVKPT